jgi:O-antigen ligase/tetratricopeptide (TPR) repeat protein
MVERHTVTGTLIEYGILILVFFVPLLFSTLTPTSAYIKLYFFEVVVLIISAVCAASLLFGRQSTAVKTSLTLPAKKPNRPPLICSQSTGAKTSLTLPVAIYLLVCAFSVILSGYRHASFPEFVRVYVLCLMFFLVSSTLWVRRDFIDRFVVVLSLVLGLASAYAILQRSGFDILSWERQGMITSTFGNPDFLAAFIITVIPVCWLNYLVAEHQGKKLFFLLVSLLGYCALLYTMSRGAWLGFGVSLLFCSFILRRYKMRPVQAKRLTVLTLAACIVTLLVSWEMVHKARHTAGQDLKEQKLISPGDPSLAVRPYLWASTLKVIFAHPVTGTGIGTFGIYFPLYRIHETSRHVPGEETYFVHAHNEYLETWSELGTIGFAVFVWVVVTYFVVCLKLLDSSMPDKTRIVTTGMLTGVVALLVHNFFCVNLRFISSSFFLWLFMGLSCAFQRTVQNSSNLRIPPNRIHIAFVLIRTVLLCTVIVSVLLVIPITRSLISQIYLRKGVDAIAVKNWGKSAEPLKKAIRYEPWNMDAHFRLAYVYQTTGNYGDSLPEYERVLKLNPNYYPAYINLASLYMEKGDTEKAIGAAEKALQYDKYLLRPYLLMAHIYRGRGDFLKADNVYRMAEIAGRLNAGDYDFVAANGHAERGEWGPAIEAYLRLTQRCPENAISRERLSLFYQAAGDTGRSDENMGIANFIRGNYDAAVENFSRALQNLPDAPALRYHLGISLARRGELAKAIEELQIARTGLPSDPQVHMSLGTLYYLTKQYGKALKEFQEVLRLDPANEKARSAVRDLQSPK